MAEESGRQPLLADAAEQTREIILDVKRGGSCALAAGVKGATNESKKVRNKLIFALVICFIFMIVEVAGGIVANSLAVLTDAAHLLSDVSGFGVALFANFVASQSSMHTHTFGYHRIEVLGALVSVLTTWLVTGILLWEAADRILHPVVVNGKMMFLLAMVGVAVNVLNFVVLGHHGHGHSHGSEEACGHGHGHGHSHGHAEPHSHSHDHEQEEGSKNINLHGAILHVIGDLVQSIGVAIAGIVIWWKQDDPRWGLADPICTFLFAFLVLMTTWAILRDISDILMERVPRAHDAATIQTNMEQIDGVEEVHDLHVWALTPGIPLLAVHLNLSAGADGAKVLQESTQYCRNLGIDHSTIQLINNGEECCGQNISAILGDGCPARGEQTEEAGHDHEGHNHSGHGHLQNGHSHTGHSTAGHSD